MVNLSGQLGTGSRSLAEPSRFVSDRPACGLVFGPFRANLLAQDAPRACMPISDRLAITRLASPNSEYSCPWFFASPL